MSIRINGNGYKSTLNDKEIGYGTSDSTAASISTNKDAKGTYHMADNSHLYEIQRTNNFEFVVDFSDMIQAGGTTATGKTYGADIAQEVLRMSVSQVAIPHFSQQPIEIKRGNSTLKYAGVPTFTDGSLTLNDYIGADTKAIIMAWQNLSYNVATEKVGLASDYKKQATLIEYTPDLQIVRSWTLYGCWITGITEPDFNSEDGGKHTISVNIAYDKAILNNGDE